MSSGFLLINKPKTWTSHDVVGYLRKITGIKKIGHAGTLDPFAEGLLVVAIGREATKKIDQFKNFSKTYIATLELGKISNTYDSTGEIKILKIDKIEIPEVIKIKQTLQIFLGKQKQIPPMFSAKKVNGQKLYELARKGMEIERRPSEIEIFNIEILEYSYPILKIEVVCSSGTYIRSLANDLGQKLGCGAFCQKLTRTAIGKFDLKNVNLPLKKMSKKNWKFEIFTSLTNDNKDVILKA